MKPSLRIGPQAPGPAPLQRRLINRPARKRVGCVGHPTRPRRLPPNGPDSRVARPAAGSPVDGRPLPGTSRGRCPASTTCARRERIRQPTFAPRAQRKHAVGWQGSPSSQAQRQAPGSGADPAAAESMPTSCASRGGRRGRRKPSGVASPTNVSIMLGESTGAEKPLWALLLALTGTRRQSDRHLVPPAFACRSQARRRCRNATCRTKAGHLRIATLLVIRHLCTGQLKRLNIVSAYFCKIKCLKSEVFALCKELLCL